MVPSAGDLGTHSLSCDMELSPLLVELSVYKSSYHPYYIGEEKAQVWNKPGGPYSRPTTL